MRVHALTLLLLQVELATSLTHLIDNSYIYTHDSPNGIQYSSNWEFSASYPEQYNNTLHYSSVPGSDLVYLFQGDAIYYIGDQNPHAPIALWIDGAMSQIDALVGTALVQQPLWFKKDLGPGDHELVIRHNGTPGSPMALDFLRIEYEGTHLPLASGPAASIVPPNALIADDSTSDFIQYSPSSTWNSTSQSSRYFNNSLHTTNEPGAQVTFKFNGTAVWYFSDMGFDHGKMLITLDGSIKTTAVGFTVYPLSQRLLWSATGLSDGEHTVMITHADADGKLMTLDFFRYLPSMTSPAPSSIETITSTVTILDLPTASSDTNMTPSSDSFVGIIIGGTLGGSAILILLGTLISIRHRRSKRRPLDLLEDYKQDYAISPYGYISPYITVDSSSSSVFSEHRISEDVRPLMSSTSHLALPDTFRYSTTPTIGTLASAYPARSRSPSISSDVLVASVPPGYRQWD